MPPVKSMENFSPALAFKAPRMKISPGIVISALKA